jgi:hypothetical protein
MLPSRMNKKTMLIAWELLLLAASILVFRSAWLLLDRLGWASSPTGLGVLLGAGVVLLVVALRALNRSEKLP